jgi:hypothetical protein
VKLYARELSKHNFAEFQNNQNRKGHTVHIKVKVKVTLQQATKGLEGE